MKIHNLSSFVALTALVVPMSVLLSAQSTSSAHKRTAAHTSPAAAALPKNIPPAHGIMHTAYALRYIDIKVGTGELAPPDKYYTVDYTGWLASDGTKFDSSVDRGKPFTFNEGAPRVIPGWYTGFNGMRVGGKRRLFIPYQLAYGLLGRPPVIPPKSDLIFDIELISVSDTLPMPPALPPADPAQPSTSDPAPKPAAPPQ